MRTLVMVVVTVITFNLFAVDDGVKFCQNSNLEGLCSETTSTIFDLNGTYWYYWNGWYLVPVSRNDAISSIQVASGWEIWACTNNNNNGSCIRFTSGTYNMSNYAGFNESISSITVQPASFKEARSFYGSSDYMEGGGTKGFAYLYNNNVYSLSGNGSTGSSRRLFLKSGTNIPSLANYIVKNNSISSIRMVGGVRLSMYKNQNYSDGAVLNTSHKDLSLTGNFFGYSDWVFSSFQDNIESVKLEESPSIGMYVAFDDGTSFNWTLSETCFAINDVYNSIRGECFKPGEYWVVDNPSSTGATYTDRLRVQYPAYIDVFEDNGDSYDLVFVDGHGAYYNDEYGHRIDFVTASWNDTIRAGASFDHYFENYIGNNHPNWFYTSACESMTSGGDDILDIYPDHVADVWDVVLEKLNGAGGIYGDGGWGEKSFEMLWTWLQNVEVSESWIRAISADWRSPVYVTRENCMCGAPDCTSYMYSDYFHWTSTGAIDKKNIPSYYSHYCVRYAINGAWDVTLSKGVVGIGSDPVKTSDEADVQKAYETGMNSYDFAPVTINDVAKALNVEAVTAPGNGGSLLKAVAKERPFDIIENTKTGAVMARNRASSNLPVAGLKEDAFEIYSEEAFVVAQSLTNIGIYLDDVSYDRTVSYEKTGEKQYNEEAKYINAVNFRFKPVLDGIFTMMDTSIEMTYDAKGLYSIQTNVPAYISAKGKGELKSEIEILDVLRIYGEGNSFDYKSIVYKRTPSGDIRPHYVFEQNNRFRFIDITKSSEMEQGLQYNTSIPVETK